jgi:hypothetical protein
MTLKTGPRKETLDEITRTSGCDFLLDDGMDQYYQALNG